MAGGNVIVANTPAEWSDALSSAGSKPVIVDFTAAWCGPCQMIGPYFVELSGQYGDKVVFLKVDVDANANVAAEAGISAMPTFQVWQNGKKVDEFVGASKDKLKGLVTKYADLVTA